MKFKTVMIGRDPQIEIQPVAGLYVYHGFGGGYYFSKTGSVVSTDKDTASSMARTEMVRYQYQDDLKLAPDHLLPVVKK